MKPLLKSAAMLIASSFIGLSQAFAAPPEEPRVIDFKALEKSIGKKGGSIDILMGKWKDIRQMTIYSNARLVSYDQTFSLSPDILKSVDNDGQKSFTLHLRKAHKWSDGTPFTTEDFRYWWENVANNEELEPAGPPAAMLVNGKGPTVDIIDSHTIRYTWDNVNPLFLPALAGARPQYIYMPAHYMKQFHAKFADAGKIAELITSEKVQNWTSCTNVSVVNTALKILTCQLCNHG